MAARGPYAKGVAKRAEILDTALEVIARNGYNGATVKELADAVGLSQNGLLHYFGSKDALFVEILRHHGEAVAVEIDADHVDFSQRLVTRILDAASDSIGADGMSQLLLSTAAAASEVDHIGHAYIAHRYSSFIDVTRTALIELQSRGQFPSDGDPGAAAALIASAFDGLQLQWLYDDTTDVRGHVAYLLRSLGVVDG